MNWVSHGLFIAIDKLAARREEKEPLKVSYKLAPEMQSTLLVVCQIDVLDLDSLTGPFIAFVLVTLALEVSGGSAR